MARLEKIEKYTWYFPGSDPTNVGITALAPGHDNSGGFMHRYAQGLADDIFDGRLYQLADEWEAFERNPESDATYVESLGELRRLIDYANQGIRFAEAIERVQRMAEKASEEEGDGEDFSLLEWPSEVYNDVLNLLQALAHGLTPAQGASDAD